MPAVPDLVLDYRRCYKEENAAVIDFMLENAGDYETDRNIPLSRLAPLAHYLVGKGRKQPLEIPTRIFRSLKTAISLRKRCANWYQHQYTVNPSPALLEANQNHQFPIEVLEEVLSIFEFHTTAEDTVFASKQAGAALEQQDISIIAQLEDSFSPEERPLEPTQEVGALQPVESAATLSAGPSLIPSMTKAQRKALGKTNARDENPTLAVYLLLQSLQPIRKFVREKWGDFQRDPSQLIVASMAMNTAIAIGSRFEIEFLASFPEFDNWADVMVKLFLPAAELGQEPTVKTTEPLRGTLDRDFELPYKQLSRYRTSISKGRIDETSHKDEAILNDLFIEVSLLVALQEQMPAVDDLTLELSGVLTDDKRKISLGTVFGLVVFLDMKHTLGETAARGFDRLLTTAGVFEFTKKSQVVCEGVITGKQLSSADHGKLLSNVDFINAWVKTDPIMRFRRTHNLETELGTGKPFAFYRQHTPATGLTQLVVLLDMQRVGVNHVDSYGYVRAMAPLYNAMKCEKVLATPWQDMEKFIALHGEEYFIKEEGPEELSAHLNRLFLTEGGSMEALARNPRKTNESDSKSKGNKREARKIKLSKLIGMLDDKLCPAKDVSADITVDHIEAYLVEKAKRKGDKSAIEDPLHAQWNRTHRLGPVQLLRILEECLIEESPKLLFNYYALHRVCFSLLRNIEKLMHNEFERWIPDPPGPKSNTNLNLPMLTHFIFEHDKHFKSGKQPMLKTAAQVVEKWLSKEGNDGLTKILD